MFLDNNNLQLKLTPQKKFFDKDTLNVPYQIFASAVQSRVGFLREKLNINIRLTFYLKH